jgi:hypothetical protein
MNELGFSFHEGKTVTYSRQEGMVYRKQIISILKLFDPIVPHWAWLMILATVILSAMSYNSSSSVLDFAS